ncbi:MAG TPA: DUF6178 family protein [Polyangiales bacterium]|nr:DUF6178 family protein [Polyangiales bacterium]
MTSLSRNHVPSSSALLMRILERPELVSAVRELPAPVLSKLIDRIGLEDAGELVALASTAQLERLFDDDLWKAASAGDDETFRPDRFALWLNVMGEGGEEFLVQRLTELPQDLLALAIHRLVLVLDMDLLAEQVAGAGDEIDGLERALENSSFEEWEEFRLIARDVNAWDDVWSALLSLDRDHHHRLRALLEQCCAMSTEYIGGLGGLYQVLTSDEMLESDVAAGREDRRAAEGFITPADARGFLELARRGEATAERDPITRAYFRQLGQASVEKPAESPAPAAHGSKLATAGADVNQLVQLLEAAEVVSPASAQPLAALTAGAGKSKKGKAKSAAKRTAPLFEGAMSELRETDAGVFSERVEELGYLVNVLMAGGDHEGRRPRPLEALETVLKTCEAGLRSQFKAKTVRREQALSVLQQTPADVLFRQGFAHAGSSATPQQPERSR